MRSLFLQVLNMSITAGCIIPAVMFARFLLRGAPRKYSYLLWSVVLFRLACPMSFSSGISIFGLQPLHVAEVQPDGEAILSFVSLGQIQPHPQTITPLGANSPPQLIAVATILWCVGIVSLLLQCLVAWTRVQQCATTAVRLAGNVFESDRIRSPFVLGFLRPRILIPFGLSAEARALVVRHEQFHLQRNDHLIKLLGFALLVVHWFNPMVWLAFALMVQDMEMSCDDLVLSESGAGAAREYSTSLLSLAVNRRFPVASPLAFGETSIRERVINILRFRKPRKWANVLTAIACVLVVSVCAANPLRGDYGYRLTGGMLIEGGNMTKAAYQRFDGVYRREITLPQGVTRFSITTSTMMRITVEDRGGHQLGSSLSRDSAAIPAKAGGSSIAIDDVFEVDVTFPGTYVLVVRGEDYTGSFQVGWWQTSA